MSLPAAFSGNFLPLQLGQYQLLEQLGAGGMGVVYKAWHQKLKRMVALKVLPPHRFGMEQAVARFHREMEAIGKLDHPNIIRATDAGEVDHCCFLVMEFAAGADLARLVKLLGPFPVAEACEVSRQTAVGLQHIHEHHLVHRDIKPSNLLLTQDGTVKILDLGLARLYASSMEDSEFSPSGLLLGTPDYMSPEQAQDSHEVDIRSDLYSLGCTLYKLLTGKAPFDLPDCNTPTRKREAHTRSLAPPIERCRPDLPASLIALVNRLLAKNPVDRLATPAEVATILEPLSAPSQLRRFVAWALEQEAGHESALPSTPVAQSPAQVTASAIPRPGDLAEETSEPIPGPTRDLVLTPTDSWTSSFLRKISPSRRVWPWVMSLAILLVAGLVILILFHQKDPRQPHSQPQESPTPTAEKRAWPEDYPLPLLKRTPGQRIDLLAPTLYREKPTDPARATVSLEPIAAEKDLRYQPLWCRRLIGTGQYHELRQNLMLQSSFPEANVGCTLLALDDDLDGRWFEFEADVEQSQGLAARQSFGVFFGWQAIKGTGQAYFVRLDESRGGKPGQVVVVHLKVPTEGAQPSLEGLARESQKPDALAVIPLARPQTAYQVRVRVLRDRVTVAVHGEPPVMFRPPVDPRGAVGLWVQNGIAVFGRAAVTTLPELGP